MTNLSGVMPAAELRSGWQVSRVSDMAILINGYPFASELFSSDGEVPLVRIRDVTASSFETFIPRDQVPRTAWIERNDLLIGMDGDFNTALWTRGPAALNQRVCVLRPRPNNDIRFIAYAIPKLLKTVNDLTYATTVKHLSSGDVNALRVARPDMDTQRRIADYLDVHTAKIDALIGKQEQLISALRERRQSLVDGHFGSSEENRPRRVRNLLVAKPTYGVLVPVYVETDDSVPFIRVGDLAKLHAVSPSAQISQAQSAEYSRSRIVGGEVLLGVVGRMGQVAIAPERLAGANVARAVAVLRCADQVTSELLAFWLTSTMFLDQANLLTSGDSVQPTLGMGDLTAIGLQWPRDAESSARVLSELKHEVAVVDALTAKVERFIELSKERRQALISAAVTGKIDVRGLS